MLGPEWVAQQKKLVRTRMMNCGERSACARDISAGTGAPDGAAPEAMAGALASAGGRGTRSATGIMIAATTSAMTCIEKRQSWFVTSQAASGDIVSGAMPMPADTSETARLRWVSNQPVTVAIIGAKIEAIEPPTIRPNSNWNAISEVAWLARARDAGSTIAPVSTTGRGPNRSDKAPQAMLVKAMARKPMVMALDMPVTDQPVSAAIGFKNTGSENMPPIATQPSRPPAATITQR